MFGEEIRSSELETGLSSPKDCGALEVALIKPGVYVVLLGRRMRR